MKTTLMVLVGFLATACGSATHEFAQSSTSSVDEEIRAEFTVELKASENVEQCLGTLGELAGTDQVEPFKILGHQFAKVMIVKSKSPGLEMLTCVESVFEVIPRFPRPVGSVGNQ